MGNLFLFRWEVFFINQVLSSTCKRTSDICLMSQTCDGIPKQPLPGRIHNLNGYLNEV